MNLWILLIETVFITIIFNFVIFIPLCKNPVWWIHDYPKDIQEEYFKTHERIPAEPLSKTAIIKKGIFLFICLIVLVGLMSLAQAKTFLEAFLGSFFIWFIISAWDCFFMDWILFANIKVIRLPDTEHMDKEYHQKKYHFVHGLIGILIGIFPCMFVGVSILLINL
ncbi:MAG: hypothetical protein KIB53_02180 [Paraclostridium bifermentans]|uniref:hypothetical protein n=1 Tax=Paraclostridium bifermentans TaxID=1490 RepID=UPI001C7E6A51|nr:hypothetical protein [Paraclostridium bifermentans]MBS5952598.1 hypothetical protein [Paraclostridium bifermentans]GIM32695.1 hypothetical protein PAGU1678_19650 [Paraclostridium bifermentans subsp. muricolitidis]